MIGRRTIVACALLAVAAMPACDESQTWHRPDWSLARMQEQPRVDPFDPQTVAPPPFTVARGEAARGIRPPLTPALVQHGRVLFEQHCAPCHGIRGDGDSVVATKMLQRKPTSLIDPSIRALSDERIHAVVTQGYGLMPPYANELEADGAWATVTYVRALEIAQGIDAALLPPEIAANLPASAPGRAP